MWNKIKPPPPPDELADPHTRLQSVEWTAVGQAKLIHFRQETQMTCAEIASVINTSGRGVWFDSRQRGYTKRDIQRQLKKLFPSELDVTHTMCALKEMRSQKGWETLRYVPTWMQTERGVTLKSLTVEMPHADELVKRFGNVIHIDATFDTLIYGHKVCFLCCH